jgi:hypothetical protein
MAQSARATGTEQLDCGIGELAAALRRVRLSTSGDAPSLSVHRVLQRVATAVSRDTG